jgi:hypothetical protein
VILLQLHLITITFKSSQSVTASGWFHSLLDCERLPFHCDRLIKLILAADQINHSLIDSLSDSCQSQSYVTTDGQSASQSWNKAPIWGLRPDLYYSLMVTGFLMWGALSDERTGLSFARVTV